MKALLFYFTTILCHDFMHATYDCIKGCACEKTASEAIADCIGRNFTSVPQPEDYQINVLMIQYNQIMVIRDGAFDFYTKLKRANLRGNGISSIEQGSFDGLQLSNIEFLDFSYNRLKDFPVQELRKVQNSLETLILSYNGLRDIPVGISSLHVLKELDLSSNSDISDIPPGSLPSSLVTLNMRGTKIARFKQGSFGKLINLRTLVLSDNGASGSVIFENGAFDDLESLELMDLSGCFCRRLPRNSFTALTQLETLLLRRCWLREMPILGKVVTISSHIDSSTVADDVILRKRRNTVNFTTNEPELNTTVSTILPDLNTTIWYNPNLKKIDISYNRNIYVTAASAKFPPSLININLRSTSVRVVDDNLFSQIPNVEVLDLRRSKIREITKGAFVHLTSAKEIGLSENPIQVPPVLPPSLTSLNLTNVKIVNLTKDFLAHTPLIQEANLQNGVIEVIEDMTFIAQGEMTILNLTGNNIDIITPKALAMGDYIYDYATETLVLWKNGDISKRSVNAASKLLQLDLSHNTIREIKEDAFSTHSQLQMLRLDENTIIEITETTFLGLPKLRTLRLENNNLDYIAPHAFRQLAALEILDLHNNMLEIVHSEYFARLKNLKKLYLHNNALLLFHPISVPSLVVVDFSYNNLTSLPRIHSTDLQEFRCYRNPIEEIEPNIFDGVPNIVHLDLSVLRLSYINYTIFKQTAGLKFLDLSRNSISNFIDVTLPSLEEFRISENDINHIVMPLHRSAPNLKILHAAFNNITHVHPDTFAGSLNLRSLDLSGNNLYCDCALLPFVQWVLMELETHEVDVINADEYMCEGPTEMYTELVLHAVSDLDCKVQPEPSKSDTTLLAIGIAIGITFFVIVLVAFLFCKRSSSSNRSERLQRPSTSTAAETEQHPRRKLWCCIPCKKWLAKESFRDRMFSSHSRTEEEGLMATSPTSSSPTEMQEQPTIA